MWFATSSGSQPNNNILLHVLVKFEISYSYFRKLFFITSHDSLAKNKIFYVFRKGQKYLKTFWWNFTFLESPPSPTNFLEYRRAWAGGIAAGARSAARAADEVEVASVWASGILAPTEGARAAASAADARAAGER